MIRSQAHTCFPAPSRCGWLCLFCLLAGFALQACGPSVVVRRMETTGYCGCGQCCGWERGSWKCLKLNFWNKTISTGKYKGEPYSGLTASGTKPHEPRHGLFTVNTLTHPWMLPFRLVLPWLWLSRDGTLAADTRYYPFGTRMYIDQYGYGVVEDRGSAIRGPDRLDLFFDSHSDALDWGRKRTEVRIYR